MLIFADPSDCTDGVIDGLTTFNAQRFDSIVVPTHFSLASRCAKFYITAEPKNA